MLGTAATVAAAAGIDHLATGGEGRKKLFHKLAGSDDYEEYENYKKQKQLDENWEKANKGVKDFFDENPGLKSQILGE